MPYYETLQYSYTDSNGFPGFGATTLTLRTKDAGGEYTPPSEEEDMDWSVVLYAIIFLIIAFIVFLIGFGLGGKGGGKSESSEKPYEPFEDEYTPSEPSLTDEPSPAPEEDVGPPPPDDKPPE